MSTAQASQRAKEIGIRKTLGSSQKQLIGQFMGETLMLVLLSALLSLGYKPAQASKAVSAAFAEGMSSETLIKAALKSML